MYEPCHGSAPDIAGQGKANPYAMLLSVAMMLRYSLARDQEADLLESVIHGCWKDGILTRDLRPDGKSTVEIPEAVCQRLAAAGTGEP